MKRMMKKAFAVLMAAALCVGMCVSAFAEGPTSGTITIENAVTGDTYSAYKIFDATLSSDNQHISYTYSGDAEAFNNLSGNDYFRVDAQGYVTVQDAAKGTGKNLSVAAIDFLKANYKTIAGTNPTATSAAAANNTATITVPYGYYVIVNNDEAKSAITVDSTQPNATVKDKNSSKPTDKDGKRVRLYTESGTEEYAKVNNMSIGDIAEFEISFNAVNFDVATDPSTGVTTSKQITQYVVKDTLGAGFTLDKDSWSVKVGETTLEKGTGFTVSDDGLTVTIPWTDADGNSKYSSENVVVLTYRAALNANAGAGGTATENDAKITYSKEGDQVEGEISGGYHTDTYTAQVQLTKVDGTNTAKTLAGAKFQISGEAQKIVVLNEQVYKVDADGTLYMLKDGTYTETEPTDATKAQYDSTTTKYSLVDQITTTTQTQDITTEAYVDSTGKLVFKGLGAGTYTIKELVAPEGYNRLANDMTLVVSFNDQTKTWSATLNENAVDVDKTSGTISFNVENNTGSTLPSTGGIGTTIFYVVGGVLVIGAGVLLITKKRMGK